MNTHQKFFFSGAVAFGLVAAAFASSPAPATAVAPTIQLERTLVIGHRAAPEITLERTVVLGHRSDVMVANRTSAKHLG